MTKEKIRYSYRLTEETAKEIDHLWDALSAHRGDKVTRDELLMFMANVAKTQLESINSFIGLTEKDI